MCAGELGRAVHQRHHVLQLVAVTERAARLIKRSPSEKAGRQALVEEPAIEQDIHRRFRRLDLHGAEHRVPMLVKRMPRRVHFGGGPEAIGELDRVGLVPPLTENEMNVARLTGREIHVRLENGARVRPALGRTRESPARKRLRLGEASASTEELRAIEGEAMRRAVCR